MYILHAFHCKILHLTISRKVLLGPNKIIHMKNFSNFVFIFAYNMPCLSQTLFVFLTLVS